MYKRQEGNLLVLILLVLCSLHGHSETAAGTFPKENENAATPIWRHAPGGAVLGVPAIQAGTVVAVLDGGHLKAYTLEGTSLWDYWAKTPRLIPFVSRNREGTSYICRTDGTLIAVNRAGRELWQLKPGPITAPVVTGWDGRIFVTTEEKIFCYTASGYQLWSRELAGKTVSGPFLTGNGGIVTALEDGELLELDPFGKAHSRSIGEAPAAIIPIKEGTLILLRNGSLRLFRSGHVPARNVITLRGTPMGGSSKGDEAAILLANGSVALVSLSNGKQKWIETSHIRANEIKTNDDFAMLWDERGIYVFTQRGATGFSIDGRRLWTLTLSGASSIPVLGDEGTLFSGGEDWILYAYKVENRILPRRQSLYGPAPEGNYGLADPPPSPWAEDYFKFSETQMGEELGSLRIMIQEGRVGENEMIYAAYLREISGSSMSPKASKSHPAVHVPFRAEAARLLGYFGSRETIPFLTELYLNDTDSVVRTAAAEAIGRIGTDPEGIALMAFSKTINAANRDERVLRSVAAAIGSLCRFSGPPLSDSGLKLLGIMERDFMPAAVRAQARQEIASLR
ncbi:MAG: PQQ-binding-like beta-propeller repeat protein [Treponema sp.]|nr:PQQ-binding-like beta-propeller repeat protein [Treponema sp.]